MTAIPAPPVSPVSLLSQEQMRQLAAARLTYRKIRRAIRVATFDGWTIAIFAALSILFSLSSAPGLVMGTGMAIIAYVELAGANRLRRLDPRAPGMLACNQLAFALLLIGYALWSLHSELGGSGTYSALAALDPAAAGMLKPIEGLTRLITTVVYASLIAVAILAQGGTALFYISRAKYFRAYLAHTPAWITQMQQAGISL